MQAAGFLLRNGGCPVTFERILTATGADDRCTAREHRSRTKLTVITMTRKAMLAATSFFLASSAHGQNLSLAGPDATLARYAIIQQIGSAPGLNGCHFAVNAARVDEYAASRAEYITRVAGIPSPGFTMNWARGHGDEIAARALLRSCGDWQLYAKRLSLLTQQDHGKDRIAPESEEDWIDVPRYRSRSNADINPPQHLITALIKAREVKVRAIFAIQAWHENSQGVRTYGWWGYTNLVDHKSSAKYLLRSITITTEVPDWRLTALLLERQCAETLDAEETQPTTAGDYGRLYARLQVGATNFRPQELPSMPTPACSFDVVGKFYKGSNFIGFKNVRLGKPSTAPAR
jgi:hypothetical protein